ncbi:transient receptor potential cation channel subfamily V member 6 [Biomphalaria glabrata]|nr:transient receptor potential cation channel subfamily V member 6-like; partial [Biomphalaria glabrata]
MFSGKVSSLPKPKDQELQHIYNIIKQNNAVQADIGNKTPQMKNSNEAQQKLQDFVDNYSMDEGSIKERLETFRCSADNCDTLLHAAVTYDARIEFIQGILQHCPDLINTTRQGGYEGQNVLHMAIAKGDIELTKVILEASKNKEMLLTTFAKGSKFKKTVVMGETPLSIAVLTLRTEMIDLLLEHGARIDQVNSKGDNVIHTLMKFAKLKREKIPEIIDMLKYLNKTIFRIHNANETREVSDLTKNSVDVNDCVTLKQTKKFETSQDIIHRMWFQENEDLETPLKLTTSRGLWEIFNVMMKMENVFCLPGNFDGANYTHFYDITEIDHIAQSRGFEPLSYFTLLFTDLTLTSFLTFGLIISMAYSTFTFSMYMLMESYVQVEEFSDFGNTTLTMFSYMLGIKELTFLNEVDPLTKFYVGIVYVGFMFTTFIYLINSLIAQMAGSTGDILKDRKLVAILQKSSVIIFLEVQKPSFDSMDTVLWRQQLGKSSILAWHQGVQDERRMLQSPNTVPLMTTGAVLIKG